MEISNKTLNQLEGSISPPIPKDSSSLICTCYNLRKKKIGTFSVEDYRILIGQDIGLNYLIPLALKILEQNILAEGDYYEGDLWKSVLSCSKEFWGANSELKSQLIRLFEANRLLLESSDISEEIKKSIFQAFDKLLQI
jgi:hypothetical protein